MCHGQSDQLIPRRMIFERFPQWQSPPQRPSFTIHWQRCSGHWQAGSYFHTYVFFFHICWRGGEMWTGSFHESLFCSYSGGFGMSSSWKDRVEERAKFPHRRGGTGVKHWRQYMGGGWTESWELVTGLCEIYSNFFNYWHTNSPPELIVGGQILGKEENYFASIQRERGHPAQGNKVINSCFCVMMQGKFNIPFCD